MCKAYTVQAWVRKEGIWGYKLIWEGDSLLTAIWMMWKLKRANLTYCISLEWRPSC